MFNSGAMQKNSIACLLAYSLRSPQNYFHAHMVMMRSVAIEREREEKKMRNREKTV
jgi:hypothetical protein